MPKLRDWPAGTDWLPGSFGPPRTGAGSISIVLVDALLFVTTMLSASVGFPVLEKVPSALSVIEKSAALAAGAHSTNMDSIEASIPVTATMEMVRSLASAFVFIVIL